MMMMKPLVCIATACLLALPAPAASQTPGGTVYVPPGTPPGSGPTILSTGPIAPPLAYRQFGAWLDDASTEGRGVGRVSVGAGYWRMTGGRQVDAPMIDAGFGLSDRIHVSAFVPFYRGTFDGESMAGLDDAYFSAKVVLLTGAQTGGRFGVAVSPVLELLNGDFTTGGRVHWALPVTVEMRGRQVRAYMAGGYFSRGAAFAGVALEWTAPTASVIWTSWTDSYALETGTDVPLAARDRHRVDIAVGVTQPLTDRIAAYASVGRSVSNIDAGGVSLGVGTGISIRLSRSTPVP
jgi:hypothetical protein